MVIKKDEHDLAKHIPDIISQLLTIYFKFEQDDGCLTEYTKEALLDIILRCLDNLFPDLFQDFKDLTSNKFIKPLQNLPDLICKFVIRKDFGSIRNKFKQYANSDNRSELMKEDGLNYVKKINFKELIP